MKFFLLITILTLLIEFNKSKLLFVLEVFRHGAREPLKDYWNAKDFKHWGELTGVGMRQHYNLGTFLREIYIKKYKFLSEEYDPYEIYVRSTDVNRTIQSAESHLLGLFPLGTGPKLPNNLDPLFENPPFLKSFLNLKHHKSALPAKFQPVPLHILPESEDKVLAPTNDNCLAPSIFWEMAINSPYYKNISEKYKSTTYLLGKILNMSDNQIKNLSLQNVHDIYDVFICDLYAAMPLPDISLDLWQNLTIIYNLVKFYDLTGNIDALKFYVTPFFNEVLESLSLKVTGKTKKLKWKMYSAHDTIMTIIMGALNLTNYQCLEDKIITGQSTSLNCETVPEFAANLIIELHREKESEEKYVKVRYNGNYVYLCEKKKNKCSYDEFILRLKNYLVDFDKICNGGSNFNNFSSLKSSHFRKINKN